MSPETEYFKQNLNGLNAVLEQTRIASWVWEIQSDAVIWSKECYSIFGKDLNTFRPTFEDYFNFLKPDDRIRTRQLVSDSLQGKIDYTNEHEIIRDDGSIKFIREHGHVIFDSDNNPIRIVGITQDITEVKNKENELRSVFRLYSLLSEINHTIIHAKNQSALFEAICKVATDVGQFRMAWIGLPNENNSVVPFANSGDKDGYLNDISIKVEDSPLGKGPTALAISSGYTIICNDIANESYMLPWKEQALKRGFRSSAAIPFSVAGKILGSFTLYSAEPGFFSIEEKELLRKIGETVSFGLEAIQTESKKKEAEERNIRLSRAVEQSPVSIILSDLQGNIEYVNPKFIELTGYSGEEVIGKNPRMLKSGYTSKEDYDKLWKNITKGAEWRGEFLNKKKDGSHFWESAQISPIVNSEGEITNFLAIKVDITEQKRIEEEREKMLADMINHNKNLEQFAYIVSHNLRAPVANILGINNLITSGSLTEQEKDNFLNALNNEVNRLDGVIIDLNQILHINSQSNIKKENVKFINLIDDIKKSIDLTIKNEEVSFNLNFTAAEQVTTIKPYLYSIFLNLITNSIKYRKAGERPIIAICSRQTDNKIVITYEDNGIGIDLKKFGKEVFGLYKRFSTEHAHGKGVGLFLVKKQVENLNGTITLESTPGTGTKFIMVLPI